jgi:SH3-like domain-containing protein
MRRVSRLGIFSESNFSVSGKVSLESAPTISDKITVPSILSSSGAIFQVIESKVNVRLAAASDAKILGYLTRGKIITALLEENNWIQFRFGILKGWVKKSLLKLIEIPLTSAVDTVPIVDTVSAPVSFVNVPRLNIREQPTTLSPTYHSLAGGQDVQITGRYGDWVNIRIVSDGSRGWVKSIYLTERQ